MTRGATGTPWYVYVMCFLLPFFGLAYGALERCRGDDASLRRGRWCIILGITSVVIICGGGLYWLIASIKT